MIHLLVLHEFLMYRAQNCLSESSYTLSLRFMNSSFIFSWRWIVRRYIKGFDLKWELLRWSAILSIELFRTGTLSESTQWWLNQSVWVPIVLLAQRRNTLKFIIHVWFWGGLPWSDDFPMNLEKSIWRLIFIRVQQGWELIRVLERIFCVMTHNKSIVEKL